jgi:hypothetical protein
MSLVGCLYQTVTIFWGEIIGWLLNEHIADAKLFTEPGVISASVIL